MINKLKIYFALFLESFQITLLFLKTNKLRSFLSLMGITIGIFCLVSIFSFLDSIKNQINKSIESLGINTLYIQKWPWEFSSDYPWWNYIERPPVKFQEAEHLKNTSYFSEVVVFISGSTVNIKSSYQNIKNAILLAVSENFEKVRYFEIDKGRFFNISEFNRDNNVVVLGYNLAKTLFKNYENAIGKVIKIHGNKFKVIGILKKEGTSIFENNLDNLAIIPVISAQKIFNINSENSNPSIIVKPKQGFETELFVNEIRQIMRLIRRLRPSEKDNFALNKASFLISGFENIFRVADIAGIIIGGFSILVGAFGVANIMFVSVKERTKLIGIQKALGANNYFILSQYLLESVILSLLGGLIGLFLVFIAIFYLNKYSELEIFLSFDNIIFSLLLSAIIGIIAGFLPSYNASKMNPTKAINNIS